VRVVARAGVAHEHVEAAERLGQLVDHVRRGREVGEVEPAQLGAAPGSLDLRRRLAPTLLVAVPGDADVEAGAGERDRGRLPDT
jgi:hypothetical protein